MNTLQKAVIEQLDVDEDELQTTLKDICNHGADAGFSGFIYYSETTEFYQDNKADILTMAGEMASELGTSLSEMVAGFNCLDYTAQEVDEFLLYPEEGEDYTTFENAFAWFALEHTALALVDEEG